MVKYERLLSSVATRVQQGEGRRMSRSLSWDLLHACRESLSAAQLALNPLSRDEPSVSSRSPTLWVNPTVADSISDNAVRVLTSHPQRRAFFVKGKVNAALLSMVLSPGHLSNEVNVAFLKDVIVTVLSAGNLHEQTSAQLILFMNTLTRVNVEPTGAHGAPHNSEKREKATSAALPQQHEPAQVEAFFAAAKEVAARLGNKYGGGVTTGSRQGGFPRRGDGGRRLLRRLSAEFAPPPCGPTGAKEENEPEVGFRQMLRLSTTTRVSPSEFYFLLLSLLRGWKGQGALLGVQLSPGRRQELRDLLALTSELLPRYPLLRIDEGGGVARPPSSLQMQLLLWSACLPTGIQRLRDAAFAGFAQLGDDVIASLPQRRHGYLCGESIRLLVAYEREAKDCEGADGPIDISAALLCTFSAVVPKLFRSRPGAAVVGAQEGDDAAAVHPCRAIVGRLSGPHRFLLYCLISRVYTAHLQTLRSHHAAEALTPDRLRELDGLADIVLEQLQHEHPRNRGVGDGSNAVTPPTAAMELRTLRFMAHRRAITDKEEEEKEDEGAAFLGHVAAFLSREDDHQLAFQAWPSLLEALSLWVAGPTAEGGGCQATAEEREEAKQLLCTALVTLTRLFSLQDAAVSTKPGPSHLKVHTAFATLVTLKRLWQDAFQDVQRAEESFFRPVLDALGGLLQACVLLKHPSASPSLATLSAAGGTPPQESAEAESSAIDTALASLAFQLLFSIGCTQGRYDHDGSSSGEKSKDVGGGPAGGEPSRAFLPPTALRETVVRMLLAFRSKAPRDLVAADVLHVLDMTNYMFQLGLFDPPLMVAAFSAIRNVCRPENLSTLSWKQRVLVARRCLPLYQTVEPHFSSQHGCRQIGQQCLVVPTRLCLEKYAPPKQRENGESDEADMSAYAALLWPLCVTAVLKPLRKCALDKYLTVMTSFIRHRWAPPMLDTALLKAEDQRKTLYEVEERLKEVLNTRKPIRGGGRGKAPPAAALRKTSAVDSLVEFNQSLHLMAIALRSLTPVVLREDREVRLRKAKRYSAVYSTVCFLSVRHQRAVAPTVWHNVLQQAVSFPWLFSASGHYGFLLQKALEVSAREVLLYAKAKGNKGQWADSRSLRELEGGAKEAAPQGDGNGSGSALLPPRMVSRLVDVIVRLTNVEAKLYLLQLARVTVDTLSEESASPLPDRRRRAVNADDDGSEAESVDADAEEALRRAEKRELHALFIMLKGLRVSGHRLKRV